MSLSETLRRRIYAMRNNYALGKRLASEIKSLQTELKKLLKVTGIVVCLTKSMLKTQLKNFLSVKLKIVKVTIGGLWMAIKKV